MGGTISFEDFEKKVIEKILDGDEDILIKLRKQYERVIVVSREFTGVGFFTRFKIPATVSRRVPAYFRIDDVIGKIDGVIHGVGFLLLIKDGALQELEGFTYGNEKWPETIRNYELSYFSGAIRDMEELRSKWSIS